MFRYCLIAILLYSQSALSAICASVDAGGFIKAAPAAIGDCTSLVLMDSADWPGASIWTFPSNEELGSIFFVGFTLPITCYLIAWAIGLIVRTFK